MASAPTLSPADLSHLDGDAYFPGDAGYDEHRTGFQLRLDQHPAVVVRAANVDDVVAAVKLAADRDLAVDVQATGHGTLVAADGAVLIDTSALDAVEIDAEARTARIGAGVRWGAVAALAEPHGLMPPVGSSATVGAVGYTLGGGLGWLARLYGLGSDALRSVTLVTADGDVARVDADSDPELWRGLRGLGANFGVVAEIEIELFETPALTGGRLAWPAERAEEVLKAYAQVAPTVDDDVTLGAQLLYVPDIEGPPPHLRGAKLVIVDALIMRAPDAAAAVLEPFRAIGGTILDSVAPMRPTELPAIAMDPTDPAPSYHESALLGSFDAAAIDAVLASAGPESGTALLKIELRQLGGAVAAKAGDDVVPGRDQAYQLFMLGIAPVPPVVEAVRAGAAQVIEALSASGHVVAGNFPTFGGAGYELETGYDPETWAALRELKARMDPANRLRFNLNLPPAA
jgi:FAD/FMN-containing dehydrogenase